MNRERHERLRKLGHDVKSPLGVVTMGVEALRGVRESPAEFDEVQAMLLTEGVEPLKRIIAEIVELALTDGDQPPSE